MLQVEKNSNYMNPLMLIKKEDTEVLASDSILLIKGEPGSGKSRLAMNFIAGLLGYKEELDFEYEICPEGKNVIYFSTEMTPYHIQKRLLSILDLIDEKHHDKLQMYDARGSIAKDTLSNDINEVLKEHDPYVIFFDQVADMLPNGNINDIEYANVLYKQFTWFNTVYNCSIVAILHQNQDSDINTKARGHLGSILEQKCMSSIATWVNKKEGNFKIRSTKVREGRNFDIKAEFNEQTKLLKYSKVENSQLDEILKLITFPVSSGDLTDSIEKFLNCGNSKARSIKDDLILKGRIYSEKKGKNVLIHLNQTQNDGLQ